MLSSERGGAVLTTSKLRPAWGFTEYPGSCQR